MRLTPWERGSVGVVGAHKEPHPSSDTAPCRRGWGRALLAQQRGGGLASMLSRAP